MLYSSLIRFPSAVKRSCPSGRVLWIISDRSNGLPPICYTSYGKSTCYWKQKKSHHSRLEAGRFLKICRSPRTKKYSQKTNPIRQTEKAILVRTKPNTMNGPFTHQTFARTPSPPLLLRNRLSSSRSRQGRKREKRERELVIPLTSFQEHIIRESSKCMQVEIHKSEHRRKQKETHKKIPR
jgi:hypothetical protein